MYIYYSTTGRAIWGSIQLESGSIGLTEGTMQLMLAIYVGR